MKNKNSIALVYSNIISMIYIQDSDITYVAKKGRKNKSIKMKKDASPFLPSIIP